MEQYEKCKDCKNGNGKNLPCRCKDFCYPQEKK